MAAKWGPKVQDAIREAVARGDRHSVALAKLHAGTLPGLDGPVPMPPRSFTYHWTRAKREQQRARTQTRGDRDSLEALARRLGIEP